MSKISEKKLLTHRVNYTSLEDLIDELVPRWKEKSPDFSGEDGYGKFRAMMKRFAEILMSRIGRDLEDGAARGIREALSLINDPAYYETKKRQKTRYSARLKEENDKQQAKRERHERGEFTEEERAQMIGYTQHDIAYYEKALMTARSRLLKLQTAKTIADLDVEIEWPENLFDEDDAA